IYTWSWALQSEKQIIEKLLPQNNHKATAQETNRNIQASASGVTIAIDSETGLISAVNNKKGGFSFSGGPLPDTLIGASVLKSINHYSEGNDYVIEAEFDGVLRTVTYRMLGSGVLQIDYAYIPDNGTYNFIGVSFDYPEDRVTGVRYLGRRPYRVWKNRRKGVRLGVWEKAYNNTITGETWEYPEFKGYHDEVYWAEIQTKEQPFGIMVGSNNLFLHLFSPDNPEGAYNKIQTATSREKTYLYCMPSARLELSSRNRKTLALKATLMSFLLTGKGHTTSLRAIFTWISGSGKEKIELFFVNGNVLKFLMIKE
ncbi:MAG: hypothetical protein HRU12_12425, partial [Phaeodactylibacter sp.]|nr:hypothetical protein [Phaeodactylibacter sp.]